MHRSLAEGYATTQMPLVRVVLVACAVVLAGCDTRSGRPAIQTLEPGVVRIAVTSTTVTNPLDPEEWMYRYAERLGRGLGLRVEWHVVPFDRSWELAGKDVVDVVATNLANFPDRVSPEARSRRRSSTSSARSGFERPIARAIAPSRTSLAGRWGRFRAWPPNATCCVARHPAWTSCRRRPSRSSTSGSHGGELDAVAQAESFTLDGRVIPSYGPDLALIDHHDLNPGQREESVFVVRDASTHLLEAVNAFVARTPFPLHIERP